MSKKSYIYCMFLLLPLAFISCKGKKEERKPQVPLQEVSVGDMPFGAKLSLDSVDCLPLKEPLETIASIDGIQVFNDTIYVFDKATQNYLMSFDRAGRHIATFGQRGNAENEYLRLWAFDVDEHYVYLYDRAKRKMLCYTHDGQFVSSVGSLFRGDSFKVLENGNFLFSMALGKGLEKLCLVDKDMKIEKVLLRYSADDKDGLANSNQFQRAGDRIFYNKELDDTLYAFSLVGECVNRYLIDFGDKKLPTCYRHDFERMIEEGKDGKYAFLEDCPLVVDGLLIASVSYLGRHAMLYYDLKEQRMLQLSASRCFGCIVPLGADKDGVVGHLDMDSYEGYYSRPAVDKQTKDFLNDGGHILLFSKEAASSMTR